jgi:hypothetical protein
MKIDKSSEALLGVLLLSTAYAETTNWNSNMVPLRKILSSKLGVERGTIKLDEFLDSLPIRLPKKGPKIEELLEIDMSGIIFQKQSREEKRIGVGYKDKGNLPTEESVEGIPSEVFVEVNRTFEVLLRQTKHKYAKLLKH